MSHLVYLAHTIGHFMSATCNTGNLTASVSFLQPNQLQTG